MIAVSEGYFTPFLKYFIAEEFSVSVEYSFAILALLNYMNSVGASLKDALVELFKLPSHDSVCEVCVTTLEEDKKLVAEQFNFLLIQRGLADQQDIDDSYDDSDYKNESGEC